MSDTSKREPYTYSNRTKVTHNRALKWFYLTLGTISVGLGFLGIFLPLLPTTAFLLLAAWCYARSSRRFYNWLLNNRLFGQYITSYLEGKGVPKQTKIWSVILLWITILTSALLFVNNIYIRILLVAVAIGVSLHIFLLPTNRMENKNSVKSRMREKFSSGE